MIRISNWLNSDVAFAVFNLVLFAGMGFAFGVAYEMRFYHVG